VIARHPIDPTGVIVLSGGREVSVGSASELISLLADSEEVSACFARTFYEYTRRRPSSSSDACAVSRAAAVVREGAPLADLFVLNVADATILTRRLEGE
jgi:hypothetical protein